MKDFERVIKKFSKMGRAGLSLQALSEICGRRITAKDIAESSVCRFTFCCTVMAPLVRLRVEWNYVGNWLVREEAEAELLLGAFPWPKYKGLKNMKGQSTTGLSPRTLGTLRKVAKNERKTRQPKTKQTAAPTTAG